MLPATHCYNCCPSEFISWGPVRSLPNDSAFLEFKKYPRPFSQLIKTLFLILLETTKKQFTTDAFTAFPKSKLEVNFRDLTKSLL